MSLEDVAAGFDAEQFAADVAAFGAEYVTFTAWHAGMEPLYPSTVMDSWRAGHTPSRDVIQDLIEELEPYGIKLVLYIHAADGFEFSGPEQSSTGWNDPTNNYNTWNNFVNEAVQELGNRYGDGIDGFWADMVFWDGFSTRIDAPRLHASMKAGNPDRVIIGNGGLTDAPAFTGGGAIDYASREYYPGGAISGWKPSQNQTVTIATNGTWWASVPTGTNAIDHSAEDMYRFSVLQAGANTRGGGVSWNVSPYADSAGSIWEDGVEAEMLELGTYVDEAGDSLRGTGASGAYPTPVNATVNTIPNGVVALASEDGAETFLHVLTPPAGSTLVLPPPSDHRLFGEATLHANGHPVTVAQDANGVTLTLAPGDSWDSLDTVIRVENTEIYYDGGYTINNDHGDLQYVGTWGRSSPRGVGDYADDVQWTQTIGDSVILDFEGSSVQYIAPTGPEYGEVKVTVDGGTPVVVDAFSSAYTPQQKLFSIDGLSSGTHEIVLEMVGGSYFQVDAIRLGATPNVLNDSAPEIKYNGAWSVSSSRGMGDFEDDLHYTTTPGASFEIEFVGTGIQYVSATDFDYGDAEVYLDGVPVATVNALTSTYQSQQVLYSVDNLELGVHTLRVEMVDGAYFQLDSLIVQDGW